MYKIHQISVYEPPSTKQATDSCVLAVASGRAESTDYHRRYDYHRTDSRMASFLCKSIYLCESVKSVAPYRTLYFLSLKEFSMLEISAWKAWSTFSRCSMALQLWMTVEWSRLPINCPIRPAGIFVYFCAKNIDT